MSSTIPVQLPTEVPLTHNVDVAVIGGGPGGIGAAIAAAREGRNTLLVEHYGFLGGMASAAEVNPFMPNHAKGECLDKGIYIEWKEKMAEYQGIKGNIFDPNIARLAAEDMCLDAGVQLLFHHRTAHVQMQDSKIEALILHSKSGLSAIKATVFIDSTGDGDVAALAGAPFEMGGEGTKYVQPMTLCFKLKLDLKEVGTDPTSFWKKNSEAQAHIQSVYKLWKEKKNTCNPRENVLMFAGIDPYFVHFNSTRVIHKDATNGQDLSDAEIEGRKQMRELVSFFRLHIPGFKNASYHSVATQIGIRESRRILGRSYLKREDYINESKTDDCIARVNYCIDIHNPDGGGTEITRIPDGSWYEIPYGCIVPQKVNNLLMGCRALSVDHAIHSSVRVMPPIISIGQAAGTAAALACETKVQPADIDTATLIERLIKQGRNLTK